MVARDGSNVVVQKYFHRFIQITYPIRQISGAGDLVDTLIAGSPALSEAAMFGVYIADDPEFKAAAIRNTKRIKSKYEIQ